MLDQINVMKEWHLNDLKSGIANLSKMNYEILYVASITKIGAFIMLENKNERVITTL